MLSILVPIFNFDIRPLVADLHGQCEALGIGYEIVCYDDGSMPDFKQMNQEIWKRPNVIYREMPQNLGRSAIRNALGKAARFDYLLFMDCDSKVVSPDFIEKYLQQANPERLVYGGRCYQESPPADASLYFHWYYGRYREQRTAAKRSRSVYHAFMTNNFLVPKGIFLDILFDETLRQYGHEDTLFGMELARRKVPILHIDNPLEHIGLETVDVFLRKTEQGIENLAMLNQQGKPIETKLLATYFTLKKWGPKLSLALVSPKIKNWIINQLASKNPKLWLFDLYKLGVLATCFQAKIKSE
jgi:glycosyltransferase involved in cell wall biosynthesis